MRKRTGSTAKSRKTYVTKKGYSRFKDSGTYVHRWAEEKNSDVNLRLGKLYIILTVIH
jgi:hypothetical protein